MTTIESTRLFPVQRSPPTSTPLSILDATVVRFPPTGAIWIYNKPSNQESLVDHLRTSFIDTLSKFPQWSGQLQWAPVTQKNHTERFNRPIIKYGTDSDPGVEWRVVEQPIRADAIAPTATERAFSNAGSRGAWIGDDFNENLFISSNPLALSNLRDYAGLSGMQVQITLFTCGGYAVGVKLAHCLADALALTVFMHIWSINSQKSFGVQLKSMAEPVFDPELLDSCAGGDIDSPDRDQSLTQTARALPLHRYSWWDTSDEGYPELCIPTTENSKPLTQLDHTQISPSQPAPWLSWGFSRPVSFTLLHFTGTELSKLKALALADGSRADISRLDALLAHMWKSITRARGYEDSSRPVYLDLSLGARDRVSPTLPETFLGSPLFLTHIGGSGSSACQETLGETASRIRGTMKQFTSDAVAAMLHDAAFEVSPQRLWQAFLGSEHTLVTSWLRLRLYDVDFVGGQPRYVHAIMPKMDGCVQIMDSAIGDGGMDVALYLDQEAMGNLLGGECLRVNCDMRS